MFIFPISEIYKRLKGIFVRKDEKQIIEDMRYLVEDYYPEILEENVDKVEIATLSQESVMQIIDSLDKFFDSPLHQLEKQRVQEQFEDRTPNLETNSTANVYKNGKKIPCIFKLKQEGDNKFKLTIYTHKDYQEELDEYIDAVLEDEIEIEE